MKNIYVLGVDMEGRTAEEIARDAVAQIAEMFDKLVEEQNSKIKVKKQPVSFVKKKCYNHSVQEG